MTFVASVESAIDKFSGIRTSDSDNAGILTSTEPDSLMTDFLVETIPTVSILEVESFFPRAYLEVVGTSISLG